MISENLHWNIKNQNQNASEMKFKTLDIENMQDQMRNKAGITKVTSLRRV